MDDDNSHGLFSISSYLETREKLFQCNHCDKSFPSQSNLNIVGTIIIYNEQLTLSVFQEWHIIFGKNPQLLLSFLFQVLKTEHPVACTKLHKNK